MGFCEVQSQSPTLSILHLEGVVKKRLLTQGCCSWSPCGAQSGELFILPQYSDDMTCDFWCT